MRTALFVHPPESQATLSGQLAGHGYRVRCFVPGRDDVNSLGDRAPDLLVVDLDGPWLEAPTLVARLRASSPAPLLVVRHLGTPESLVSACLAHGADDVLAADAPVLETELRLRRLTQLGTNATELLREVDQLRSEVEELRQLSATDPLTQLHNRRQLGILAEREVARCHRYGTELSCIMLDIDHFKDINDCFGHLAGDEILKSVAWALTTSARDVDIVSRYGGDEFCILLPDTPCAAAMVVGERVRTAVSLLAVQVQGQPLGLSVSAGVAAFHHVEVRSAMALIAAADDGLYQAKHRGRDRLELAVWDEESLRATQPLSALANRSFSSH